MPHHRLVRLLGLASSTAIFSTLAQTSAVQQPSVSPHPAPKTQSDQILLTEHRWIASPPRHDPAAYFTNLKNGDTVPSPFVVQFGMSYWGIAPAEHSHARTGHHHLLVNTPLPMPPTASLPFTKNYLHFGKGQMQTVLDLPPGKHTLRLLLANHNHVPHMVYSDEITVNVSQRDAQHAEQLKKNEPALLFPNLKDGDVVRGTFRIQFHAANLNVSNKLTNLPETGYFQLKVTPDKGRAEKMAFPNGQTETWLRLPDGEYKLQLEFVKNPSGELHSVVSKTTTIRVAGGGAGS